MGGPQTYGKMRRNGEAEAFVIAAEGMFEMRFDLSGCGAGLDESANNLLQLGPWAESLGYDGLWLNEEHFGQNSRVCLSPILLATALAMRTRTIRIGFSVLVLPLYQPIRLAEEIATLDLLSEGRVDLGVSRGNTSRYFEAWGLDYEKDRRVRRGARYLYSLLDRSQGASRQPYRID